MIRRTVIAALTLAAAACLTGMATAQASSKHEKEYIKKAAYLVGAGERSAKAGRREAAEKQFREAEKLLDIIGEKRAYAKKMAFVEKTAHAKKPKVEVDKELEVVILDGKGKHRAIVLRGGDADKKIRVLHKAHVGGFGSGGMVLRRLGGKDGKKVEKRVMLESGAGHNVFVLRGSDGKWVAKGQGGHEGRVLFLRGAEQKKRAGERKKAVESHKNRRTVPAPRVRPARSARKARPRTRVRRGTRIRSRGRAPSRRREAELEAKIQKLEHEIKALEVALKRLERPAHRRRIV